MHGANDPLQGVRRWSRGPSRSPAAMVRSSPSTSGGRSGQSTCAPLCKIAHGMGEHAARYERVAERLTSAGYGVCANDHRGHGRTANASGELGHIADSDSWNRAVRDIYDLNRRLRRDTPQAPIFLLGHSMGSLMVQQYLCEHGDTIDGAILSASPGEAGVLRHLVMWLARIERWRLGRRERSELLRRLLFGRFNRRFEPARTPYDWLSRDEQEVDAYVEDPLCGFVLSVQGICDMLEALGTAREPGQPHPHSERPAHLRPVRERGSGSSGPVGTDEAPTSVRARRPPESDGPTLPRRSPRDVPREQLGRGLRAPGRVVGPDPTGNSRRCDRGRVLLWLSKKLPAATAQEAQSGCREQATLAASR